MKKNFFSKKVSTPETPEPDIAGFMVKIQEQLAALAEKMDALTGRVPPATGRREEPLPSLRQQSTPSQSSQRSHSPRDPSRGKRVHSRRERILHKAVCADCQKECEIPFKPSGERPVYCKPCFSKRKAEGPSSKVNSIPSTEGDPSSIQSAEEVDPGPVQSAESEAPVPEATDRRVSVTKKGVGKVTVSEIVPLSERAFPSRDRSQKPAQRAKR